MTPLFDQIQEAAAAVRAQWPRSPEVGIILGTGLGKLTEDIAAEAVIPYDAIPHFPALHRAHPPRTTRLRYPRGQTRGGNGRPAPLL